MIAPSTRQQLQDRGYLVLPALLPPDQIARLNARIEELFALEGDSAGSEFKTAPSARSRRSPQRHPVRRRQRPERLPELATSGPAFRARLPAQVCESEIRSPSTHPARARRSADGSGGRALGSRELISGSLRPMPEIHDLNANDGFVKLTEHRPYGIVSVRALRLVHPNNIEDRHGMLVDECA
jgi:hypothetical protein